MSWIKNIKVDLGSREVVIGGRIRALCDNVTVDVLEATEEELKELKDQPVILLVKPLPEMTSEEAENAD